MSLYEIIWSSPGNHGLSSPRARVKLQKVVFQVLIDLHDGCLVTAPVAVIGGRKESHYIPILTPVIPLHYQLVRPCYER